MYNNYNPTKPWTGGTYFTFLDYPDISLFVEFGNGSNDDNVAEGCDGYIIFGIIEPGEDGVLEVWGGMLDFNRETCGYDGNINNALKDVFSLIDKPERLKPLKRPESFFKKLRNKLR
ncbi:MAG: hypothetical protein E7037_06590 [Verrucomicrobia bacterium]|nr:hypothetical protein [Verrucomicrobiota bacterium]